MKLNRIMSLVAMMTLVLVGCSSTDTSTEQIDETNQETENVQNSDVIVVSHAFGETEIPSKPVRVAAISWSSPDTALALGVAPVGQSLVTYGAKAGDELFPWTLDKIEALNSEYPIIFDDTAGVDYEAINDSNPDVILATYSGITEEEYHKLSEIAPVVAYPDVPWLTPWKEQISITAKSLGEEEKGEALLAELEALIEQKKNEFTEMQGKNVLYAMFVPSDLGMFYVYLPSDPRVAYVEELGLVIPESVVSLGETYEGFFAEVSAENVDMFTDVDMIITYGDETLLTTLQADPLLSTLPAVANNAVAVIADGTPLAASTTPTPLSIPATIDEYVEILNEAAKNASE